MLNHKRSEKKEMIEIIIGVCRWKNWCFWGEMFVFVILVTVNVIRTFF